MLERIVMINVYLAVIALVGSKITDTPCTITVAVPPAGVGAASAGPATPTKPLCGAGTMSKPMACNAPVPSTRVRITTYAVLPWR